MKRLALLLPLLALAAAPARADDPATNAPAEPAGGGTPKRTSTAFSMSDPESEIEAKRAAVEQMIADAERSFNHQDLVECFKTHPFDEPGGNPDKKAWGVYFDAYDWSLDASELLDVLHTFDCPVGFSATCAGTFDLDRLLGLDLRALIVNPASDKDRIGSEDAIVGAPLQFFAWHSWTNVTVLAKTRTLVFVDISNEGPPLDASPLAELPTLKDLHLWGDWYFRNGRFPGTKLENLHLGGNSVLGEFPELGGNGLSGLTLFNTSVTNLSALRDQPLACVEISKTPVRDLSFLRGNKSLKELELRETEVRDLAPLAGTGLEHLSLECNPVDGYAPVLGLPELDLIVKTESGWLGREDILKMSAPATNVPASNAPASSEFYAEPDASAPHAEGAEVSGWAVVFEDCNEIVMSNRYVGMLRDEVIRRLGKPDKIEVHPASNLVHWVKFPAGIPSPTGDVVVLTFDNGSAQIGGETFVFLQSGSNSVEEVIGDVEIPPGVVL